MEKSSILIKDLEDTRHDADAVIFAVPHKESLKMEPDRVFKMIGKPAAIIDCFGILDDAKIRRYFELGFEVKGLGRGNVRRLKDEVRKAI